jgi:DegV family protein with EDD domain
MAKIALVTDSTGYIPQDLVDKYHITVVPQVLIWGQEMFEDGVSIMPTEFYARLKKAAVMPTSSQATVAKFQQIFQDLLNQDTQVLALLISSKLSGTINSAVQARESMPGAPIHIVDTNSTAMAMGFQVLAVARAIEQGASLQECIALAEKSTQHTGVVFAVDTLEFLHRGGRIGSGSRFLGTALNIKPILELRDGKVEALERVRAQKSLARDQAGGKSGWTKAGPPGYAACQCSRRGTRTTRPGQRQAGRDRERVCRSQPGGWHAHRAGHHWPGVHGRDVRPKPSEHHHHPLVGVQLEVDRI